MLRQRLPCLTRPSCCAGGSIAGRAIILPLPLGDLQPSLEVPRRSLVVRPCCLLLLLYMLLLLLLWWRPWLTGASWLHRRVPGRRGGGRCCHQHHPWWRLPWVGLHRHLLRQLLAVKVMGSAVFLLLVVAAGPIDGALDGIPMALVLTGIVVAVSAVGFALALLVRLADVTGSISLEDDGGGDDGP